MDHSEHQNTDADPSPRSIAVRLFRYLFNYEYRAARAAKGKHQRNNRAYEIYRQTKEESWKRPIEAIGVVLLFFYTSFAGYQSCQQEKATRAATRQAVIADEAMRVGNRPYVEVGQQKGGLVADWSPTPSGGTGIAIWFNNAGNTPAQRFYINADFLPCDPTTFTHLSLKPVPPKAWGKNGFDLKAGQSVTVAEGWPTPLTWITGSTIPAHSDFSILEDFAKDKIAAALKKGNGAFSIIGSYEYIDVFDEYCCEAFQIDNDGKVFRLTFGDWQDLACQTDIPNICSQKGRPTVPPVPEGGHIEVNAPDVGSPVSSAAQTHQ